MELTSVRCLINSISRFVHLATCCSSNMPTQKDLRNVANCMKHLKPVLDNLVDNKILLDETICKECEELDMAVKEAREFLEKWSPTMSKTLSVLQSEKLFLKIQSSSLKISRIVHKLLESSPPAMNLSDIQRCMQEFQHLKLEKISENIEEAIESQKHGKSPPAEHIRAIMESLTFTSKHELLNEYISLEKERIKAENKNSKGDLDRVNHITDLISCVRDYMAKLGSLNTISGIQIPSHFRCPLSLEIMFDPVIVASGQTYERASIQRWLNNGLNMCPETHERLSHINLIPNYTVKALIENWCEDNKINLLKDSDCPNSSSLLFHSACTGRQNFQSTLQNDNSVTRSSGKAGHNSEQQKNGPSGFSKEEVNGHLETDAEKFSRSLPEHIDNVCRCQSASSAVSSIDYISAASIDVSRISNKHDNASDVSGDTASDSHTSSFNKYPDFSPLSTRQYHSCKTLRESAVNSSHNISRGLSFQPESDSNDLTTTSHVKLLVKDLKSQSTELQASAAAELRFLAKHNLENRVIIGHSGAIIPLISLLHSDDAMTQEHAVTALLNLSINENIKTIIAEEGALEPLINVLKTGNARAKENAAAALFSLSLLEDYRIKIGHSDAVKELVNLLGSGAIRGKKDAATALFNLSIFHGNKARIVQAGAIKYLVELLDPSKEMVDKSVALLANLSTIPEGCSAIARQGGIPTLVEIVETGSQRGKENAASTLLQLCLTSNKYCRLVLQEGAVPPLVALSQSGTPRAKEKAQQLLSHFRSQREGSTGKAKS